MHSFSSIDYDECHQSTYRGIILKYLNEKIKFNSGDFIVDYYDYMLYLLDSNITYSGRSSSWDHFFMDGNQYDEVYFDVDSLEFIDWRAAWNDWENNENKESLKLYNDCLDGEYPRCVIKLDGSFNNFRDVKKYYKNKKKENE